MAITIERPAPERTDRRAEPRHGPTGPPLRLHGGLRRRLRLPELAVGIVVVGACALGAVLWQTSTTARQQVAVLRRPVAQGDTITEADLRPAGLVLGDGVRAVSWASHASLLGRTAVADLPADTVLVSALVSEQPALGPGEALVGLKLEAGSYPAGSLRPDDAVAVVAAEANGSPGAGGVLTAAASVWAVTPVADREQAVLVTLRLSEADAARVSAVADHVRVVRVVR